MAEKHLKNTKKTKEKQIEGEWEIRKGERGRGRHTFIFLIFFKTNLQNKPTFFIIQKYYTRTFLIISLYHLNIILNKR